MLRSQIHDDMIAAMKAKDTVKLDAVRYVWSEIKNVEIDAKHELTDDEVTTLLRREVKKRQEAIELMRQGGREELAAADQIKLDLIAAYVPAQMDRDAITAFVKDVIADGQTDFGQVMRAVMQKVKGQADGKLVSEVVKEQLK